MPAAGRVCGEVRERIAKHEREHEECDRGTDEVPRACEANYREQRDDEPPAGLQRYQREVFCTRKAERVT
jgi:hypothetical protein